MTNELIVTEDLKITQERVKRLEQVLQDIHHTCKQTSEHEIDHAFIVEIPDMIEQVLPDLSPEVDAAEFFGFAPVENEELQEKQ